MAGDGVLPGPGRRARRGGRAWRALERDSPFGRFAAPEEVAAGILYLSSEEASYVTGTELVIDGGYTA